MLIITLRCSNLPLNTTWKWWFHLKNKLGLGHGYTPRSFHVKPEVYQSKRWCDPTSKTSSISSTRAQGCINCRHPSRGGLEGWRQCPAQEILQRLKEVDRMDCFMWDENDWWIKKFQALWDKLSSNSIKTDFVLEVLASFLVLCCFIFWIHLSFAPCMHCWKSRKWSPWKREMPFGNHHIQIATLIFVYAIFLKTFCHEDI